MDALEGKLEERVSSVHLTICPACTSVPVAQIKMFPTVHTTTDDLMMLSRPHAEVRHCRQGSRRPSSARSPSSAAASTRLVISASIVQIVTSWDGDSIEHAYAYHEKT